MIIYNVTVSVDNEVHEMWLAWMRNTHLPEVMATGHFQDARICRVLSEGDSGATYAIQYTCTDMAAYERYRDEESMFELLEDIPQGFTSEVGFDDSGTQMFLRVEKNK